MKTFKVPCLLVKIHLADRHLVYTVLGAMSGRPDHLDYYVRRLSVSWLNVFLPTTNHVLKVPIYIKNVIDLLKQKIGQNVIITLDNFIFSKIIICLQK